MELGNWRRLGTGTGDGVILCVDFGPRTGQRGFGRLADNLRAVSPAYSIYAAVPPHSRGGLRASTDPQRYLRCWLAPIAEARPRVRAVLTFCVGGRFAGPMVRAVTGLGRGEPAVVLLDPTVVSAASLCAEFDDGLDSLRAHFSAAELTAVRERVRGWGEGTDLVTVAEALCVEHRALVGTAFARAGLQDHLVDAMCGRFTTYLGYLVAAGRVGQDDTSTPATVLLSRDHPPADGYLRRFQVRNEELLGAVEVARWLADELLAMETMT